MVNPYSTQDVTGYKKLTDWICILLKTEVINQAGRSVDRFYLICAMILLF